MQEETLMADEIQIVRCDNKKEIKSAMPKLLEKLKNANVILLEARQKLLDVTPEGERWTHCKIKEITYSITVKNG